MFDNNISSKGYFLYSLGCYVVYLFFQNNLIGKGLIFISGLLLLWGVITLFKEITAGKFREVYGFNSLSRVKQSNDRQKAVITLWIVASIWLGYTSSQDSYDSGAWIVNIPITFLLLALPALFLFKIWSNKKTKK